MGMAASQARYLALVARKSNCEYEGQQINQARTVLSNQSANLFNQMLGLNVPVPPSTNDFTKQQYSYSDGINDFVLENWKQLANPEEDYNYVVTRVTYNDRYTGSQKKLNDPQVQFSAGSNASVEQIEAALKLVTSTKKDYEDAKAATKAKQEEAATLTNYQDLEKFKGVSKSEYNAEDNTYTITTESGSTIFAGYNKLPADLQTKAKEGIDKLVEEGALPKDIQVDYASVYMDANGNIAFKSDLRNLYGGAAGGSNTVLPVYPSTGANSISAIAGDYDSQIETLKTAEFIALQTYQEAERAYESLKRPTYIGNCELTLITDLSKDQAAELQQVVRDMKEEDLDTSIEDCFNENGEYLGGVYQFKMNGTTYYTTFADLNKSYASGTGINNIDGQVQLSYYNASYIKKKEEEVVKALLETDGNGRFTSVRFEDDTVTYTLNVETVTDEDAYKDAMNQYNYDNALYDKMVQDINVKTSLIQQEDQQLELRLKQLDTEQSALSTEIDAVSKIVKDNIEKSFKTFAG